MNEMNEMTCPACAGPDNAECATCHGTSQVSQETYDAFMEEKAKFEATMQLRRALQELPIENIPGVEQTALVLTTIDNSIAANIDGTELTWSEETQSWI